MTAIGDILDEFFSPSPFAQEKLWVMPEEDKYTKIVREWSAVIEAADKTKCDLSNNCAYWQSHYMINPAWKPVKSDAPKLGSYRAFVKSPPGTDPLTCRKAFYIYAASKAARSSIRVVIPAVGLIPDIQTRNLYLGSIGSFNIYTNAIKIDCSAKKALLDFWMYNSMSRRSFGRFADDPVFALCKMKTQYMWWNWSEQVDWSSGTIRTVPKGMHT